MPSDVNLPSKDMLPDQYYLLEISQVIAHHYCEFMEQSHYNAFRPAKLPSQ
jgi:hypothetical protein